jgi:hypothetical protein
MFSQKLDRSRPTLDARRERRVVLAGDHERIAGGELVPVDVPTASHAMDVVVMRMAAADIHWGQRFALFFRKSLFSFHRSLRPCA